MPEMNLPDCYSLLGLMSGAKLEEIKSSYRRLARLYHPDVNPGNQEAAAKFIQVTEAYKLLIGLFNDEQAFNEVNPNATDSPPPKPEIPPLSPLENQLKWSSYELLQQLLKERRFARAIALVEGLANRIPHDPEVRQWQAIAYQLCGRQFINEGQLDKARLYLKKALRTDPHNRALWAQVEQDFRRMELIYR